MKRRVDPTGTSGDNKRHQQQQQQPAPHGQGQLHQPTARRHPTQQEKLESKLANIGERKTTATVVAPTVSATTMGTVHEKKRKRDKTLVDNDDDAASRHDGIGVAETNGNVESTGRNADHMSETTRTKQQPPKRRRGSDDSNEIHGNEMEIGTGSPLDKASRNQNNQSRSDIHESSSSLHCRNQSNGTGKKDSTDGRTSGKSVQAAVSKDAVSGKDSGTKEPPSYVLSCPRCKDRRTRLNKSPADANPARACAFIASYLCDHDKTITAAVLYQNVDIPAFVMRNQHSLTFPERVSLFIKCHRATFL